MKALVIGCGSIGRRHLRNLKALAVGPLAIVEMDSRRRNDLIQEWDASGFCDLESGLDWEPDFVVIATPTHLHAEQARQVLRRGLDVFVEKPLSHDATTLIELSQLARQKNVVSLVGCNMRFHPGPVKVKEMLQANSLGKLLFARIHAGSYLPGWRPGADYRDNYAAREETGGGCILDCIHEIDLAWWYLGDVLDVLCLAGHLSSLEIDTEDVAALICRHATGALSEIHLDYVQSTSERGCQIVGEEGSIFWDFNARQLRCYQAVTDRWTFHEEPEEWQLNQMYVDEMRHFLECVQTRRQTVLPIPEAVPIMQIAFAAKASARTGALISTEGLVAT
jgi:predicted dehydrogenase